ncbi:hypothetical protein [uncultured Roseobacter sp.]|uniref:hypothetical protein n=2 Tax=uncultured Roseobacter sp. TaxID=114847 RepID=UPI00262A492D|nr:hypothetical protein [uncultured Roseobacter sp.]
MVRDDAQRISTRIEILKRELACEIAPEPILHPATADMYAREVQKLIKTLNEPGHSEEVAGLIRGLIDRIILKPDASKTRLVVNLEGDLAGILAISERRYAAYAPLSIDVADIKLLTLAPYGLNEQAAHEVVGKAGCGSRI